MSNIKLDDKDNYINGLKINGNLVVDGTLFLPRNANNCPNELLNTVHQNIELNACTFEGNLHIHPKSNLEVTGRIISNNFQNQYK
jgi:hypothetical protein